MELLQECFLKHLGMGAVRLKKDKEIEVEGNQK